jgi:hypothetical protein
VPDNGFVECIVFRVWTPGVVVAVVALQGFDHLIEIFCIFFFFVAGLCASVISLGHFIIVKTECNWYIRDINILPLLK